MIRIIIVDDEILSRIGLQSFLDGKEGIVVSGIFGEAEEALHFLEENVVDIVLTDIEMAEMDGLSFIREIRERRLAPGVIIVSCHEDFSYAQRAISLGTDSYILKQSLTEKTLIQEVKNVYEKTAGKEVEQKKTPWRSSRTPGSALSARYRVGVLLTDGRENGAAQETVVGPDMLVHLLEEIVSRYQMGTLFAPYNRETFILFQLDEELALEERQKTLENWLRLLQNNIGQYLTGKMTIGVSQEYEELSETREQYQNAVLAAEQAFFHPERTVFFYKEALTSSAPGIFETKKFLEESWPEQFEESFREKWRQEESLVSLISSAASSTELKDRALEYMQGFQEAALRAGAQNPLMEVLNYIDQHLDGKLTLPELAQMSCMSVPSFCKKFKEQTKMTVTQYINEKRVAYAATLLKQSKYSLEEVAELAGFSNANYLLRVFKKSTGKTIGQYRKQIKF